MKHVAALIVLAIAAAAILWTGTALAGGPKGGKGPAQVHKQVQQKHGNAAGKKTRRTIGAWGAQRAERGGHSRQDAAKTIGRYKFTRRGRSGSTEEVTTEDEALPVLTPREERRLKRQEQRQRVREKIDAIKAAREQRREQRRDQRKAERRERSSNASGSGQKKRDLARKRASERQKGDGKRKVFTVTRRPKRKGGSLELTAARPAKFAARPAPVRPGAGRGLTVTRREVKR